MTVKPIITALALFTTLSTTLVLSGCTSTSATNSATAQGAVTGMATGAVAGLLLGAIGGEPEKGMLAGATLGAIEGGQVGYAQEKADQRNRELAQAISGHQGYTSEAMHAFHLQQKAQLAREQLDRFVGNWQLTGWMAGADGQQLEVQGSVLGERSVAETVQLTYPALKVESQTESLWGQSLMGYTVEKGYSVVTRFANQQAMARAGDGDYDAAQRQFRFSGKDYRVTVTFENPDVFTWQTERLGGKQQSQVIESYRLTKDYSQANTSTQNSVE
ncbi:glycine zipper domain-containing protein [Paraferrimonas sedimenticola]|uniref:Glycine zipper domain-containing protein n=1 Tax=Paraferrimonas sedimenticola TaxID=375674 RepID=A0AA37RVV9_9GAMM|nr:glycine zipper domain-containing protein [Paraferrimonas sedimenticola]GLP95864.1 hypothetical protein GCM10007895_11700 [Paraferrimonas sedimenticola]